MESLNRAWLPQITLLFVLILLGTGCAENQSPPESAPQAELIAKQINVSVSNRGDSEINLEKDSTTRIQINDQINLDQGGLGLINFQDSVQVELFPTASILLDDIQQESGGSIFVRLDQIQGHSHVTLNQGKVARLTLETEFATITTLEDGTDFVVCHKPGVTTCVTVREGSIEFTSEGVKKTYKAGDSTFVTTGETPPPPVCTPRDELDEWLAKIQAAEQVPTLGQLVTGWSQNPCPTTAQASPTVEIPTLPESTGMTVIGSGSYQIGGQQADEFHVAQQEITLSEYWIDLFEVTNTRYQQFLEATGHSPPTIWPGQGDHPVRGVTWDEAAAYCDWANKRLPIEAEWEVAARGPEQSPPLHPWGDDPLAGGEVSNLPRDNTYAVGMFPFNQSPFGVFDMAGNVWEWTGDPYNNVANGLKVLRGGRFGLLKDMAYRQLTEPDNERFVPFAGFRCAADQVQGE